MDASPDGVPAERHISEGAFPHGPFLVEPDGALWPTRPPELSFAWRGRTCTARLNEGVMCLSAQAGAVPYTAERPSARAGALAAIARMPGELPPGWRLRVTPDHRLQVEAARPVPQRLDAVLLVGELVGFALALDPYLDWLESAGVAAGTAKT